MTAKASSNRSLAIVVAVLIVGSAAAVDPWGWAPYGPLRWALVSTACLLVAALVLHHGRLELHKLSAIGWMAFLLWGVVAGITALDPLYTWIGTPDRHMGFITAALFAAMFFAGQQFRDRNSVLPLLKAAVVALGLVGLYTILEIADLAPVNVATPSGRPGGPYGSAAYLGAAGALLLPVVAGAAIDGLDSSRWRYLALTASGLGACAALAAQTRAGWVGIAVAGAITLPATWQWLRRNLAVSAAVGIALILVAALSPIGSRVSAAFDFTDGTARGRLDEWQVGAAVATNHPITGVGFEGYRIAFAEGVDADYEQRYTRVTMPDRAHNGPLDVAATTGLPGLMLYLGAAGFLVLQSRRAVGSRQSWKVGLAAGVAGYLAQQWFLFPLAEVDPIFWLFAGVLVAAVTDDRITVAPPKWLWTVPAALAALALIAGTLDVAADHRLAAASDHLAGGDIDAALEATGDATALRPDSIRYFFMAAVTAAEPGNAVAYSRAVGRLDQALELSPGDPILRAEHASYLLRFAQAAQDPALLAAATDEWQALIDDDPVHARYHLELGNAYVLAGSNQGAEIEWGIAAMLAPTSTAPLTNLAALLVDNGRIDEARVILDEARAIDPDAPEIARIEALIDG